MANGIGQSFSKSERICSKHVIDSLFGGDKLSISAFPIRMVYSVSAKSSEIPVSILISVPKKRFHDAVDRNRMKRQIRESYRLHKVPLWQKAVASNKSLKIAFICVTDKLCATDYVEKSMIKLLSRLQEQL